MSISHIFSPSPLVVSRKKGGEEWNNWNEKKKTSAVIYIFLTLNNKLRVFPWENSVSCMMYLWFNSSLPPKICKQQLPAQLSKMIKHDKHLYQYNQPNQSPSQSFTHRFPLPTLPTPSPHHLGKSLFQETIHRGGPSSVPRRPPTLNYLRPEHMAQVTWYKINI